jgi:hypothetical protein
MEVRYLLDFGPGTMTLSIPQSKSGRNQLQGIDIMVLEDVLLF